MLVFIGKQAEHGTQVRATGLQQLQPIGLGFGVRLLMRKDVAFSEGFQTHATDHSPPVMPLAFPLKLLMVNVEGWVSFGLQQPFSLPTLEQLCRSSVTFRFTVTRLISVEDQPHDVGLVTVIECFLLRRADYVVRWSHD